MVKLRLLRVGRHKVPVYRIVAVDSKAKANGAYIELLGQYDPLNAKHNLKVDLIKKWLNLGAQPTDTVKALLKKEKIWSAFKLEKEANKKSGVTTKTQKVAKPTKKNEVKETKKEEKSEPKKDEATLILENLAKKTKFKDKYSSEEIEKREQQTFKVVEENEYSEEEERTIIVSLDIKYIEKILDEDKTIIFMKRLPAHPVKRVIVYAIQPVGLVIGEFDLSKTEAISRNKAWNEYSKVSTLTKKEFDEYFEDAEIDGVKVMEIDGFIQYKTPKKLDKFGLTRGPSGFMYLK